MGPRVQTSSEASFTKEGVDFLRRLKRNNNREWFNARKDLYQREVKAPMLALIGEVNDAMSQFAPEHVRSPEKVMMRIYRDIRFSKDKRPYKNHVSAWWARAGMEKTSGGGFYLSVSATELTIAAGVYMPEREQLLAIRRHLVVHHTELRRLIAMRPLKALGMVQIDGMPLTRPPKGFADAGAAMDLVICKQWGLGARLPVEAAFRQGKKPGLVGEVVTRFRAAAPMVEFLNAPLEKRVSRPLF